MRESMRRVGAIAGMEWHVFRRDPAPLVVYILMPLLVMAFLLPALRLATLPVYAGANGAEQAVPGVTVMFAFLLVSQVGMTFFRDHGWRTWERLRASSARSAEIMIGKVIMPILLFAVVLTCLLGGGGLLFGLHVRGSLIGLGVIAGSLAVCLVTVGLALVAMCRTAAQFVSVSNLGAILCAGLGGALVPRNLLPDWVQAVAPISPSYWAMSGFRGVIIGGQGLGAVWRPAGMLLALSAMFLLVAALRFRTEDAKIGFS